MSNINENSFNNQNLRLSNSEYWDLMLSSDMGFDDSLIDPTTIYSGISLSADFDFNGLTAYTSTTTYYSATTTTVSAETLCDYIFTGVDNGRIAPDLLTGSTYSIDGCCSGGTSDGALILYSGNTSLEIYSVTGFNYTYDIKYSGNTSPAYDTTKFNGGWYQGIFKIEGSNYQVLPKKYPAGWTAEFWMSNGTADDPPSGTLNTKYPDNKGIFFYMGLRAENKFWKAFSGESGYTTCSGIHTYPTEVVDTYCDNLIISSTVTSTPSSGITEFNWSGDVIDNCFALRMKDDGSIGYRLITDAGVCIDNVWYPDYVVEEAYSESGLINQLEMYHIAVKWKPYIHTLFTSTINSDISLSTETGKGTLYFYINGEQRFKIDDINELSFKPVSDHTSKQIGVPYNISIGGGTQGLSEQITVGGPDPNDQNLLLEKYFGGHLQGRISKFRLHLEPLDVTHIKRNYTVEKSAYL